MKSKTILGLAICWSLLLPMVPAGRAESFLDHWAGKARRVVTGQDPQIIDVVLISDKESTCFQVKTNGAADFRDVGTGKFIHVQLDSTAPVVIRAKPPGYRVKEVTSPSPNKQIQFFFLLEDQLLTLKAEYDGTKYRVRRTGDARWLDIPGAGKVVEYDLPHQGEFEVEAAPPGYFPKILPVINPAGELVFADFSPAKGIELVSNKDYTRFLLRRLGQGDSEWEYLGVGRVLTNEVPATGGFEIMAEPIDYRPRSQTLSSPQPRLSFEFTDADRKAGQPAAPAGPQRSELTPRPTAFAGPLPVDRQMGLITQESWRAVLIGINDYSASGGKYQSLANPRSDVKELQALLQTNYGFKTTELLLDAQATRAEIRKHLFALHNTCQSDDNILIYYAGHGALTPNGGGEWICADGEELVNAEIKDILQRLHARRVLLVSDSCFSGEFVKHERNVIVQIDPLPPTPEKSAVVSQQIVANTNPGRQVLTSGNQDPVDDGSLGFCDGHSPFACQLLIALRSAPVGAPVGALDLYANIVSAFRQKHVPEDKLPRMGAMDGDAGGEFFLLRIK